MMAEEQRTTLLGAKSVADACKVSASTVHNWLRTYPDMPQPKYEIAGPLRPDGERKKSPAWEASQLVDILDWRNQRKG
ncbi:MAG TPA: hypothetical protein VK054_11985 [Beutenbergiaceae bacterium]|nr:hypothetical protein [Beutenbergiaceae bacterium]